MKSSLCRETRVEKKILPASAIEQFTGIGTPSFGADNEQQAVFIRSSVCSSVSCSRTPDPANYFCVLALNDCNITCALYAPFIS